MTQQWREAIVMAVSWGVGMAVLSVIGWRIRGIKPVLKVWNVVALALLAMVFGMGYAFRGEAFRWPMLGIIVTTLAAAILLMVGAKDRERKLE